jgi:hypothetical protein
VPTDLLQLTADLVAVRSESFDEGPLTDLVEARLRSHDHLRVERVGDNVVGRTQLGRSTRLVIGGHSDTVPANGNEVPRIDGDVLWGLGSADMKGGLAVMLELAARHPEPAVDVTYVVYAREEVAAAESGLGELFASRPDLLVAMSRSWANRPTAPSRRAARAFSGSASSCTAHEPTPPGRGWVEMPSTGRAGSWRCSRRTSPDGR